MMRQQMYKYFLFALVFVSAIDLAITDSFGKVLGEYSRTSELSEASEAEVTKSKNLFAKTFFVTAHLQLEVAAHCNKATSNNSSSSFDKDIFLFFSDSSPPTKFA